MLKQNFMISRRSILRGLIAAPVVVAAGSLMPLRGYVYDPLVRLQSWPIGETAYGEWWAHQGPLSEIGRIGDAMVDMYGRCYSELILEPRETYSHSEVTRTKNDKSDFVNGKYEVDPEFYEQEVSTSEVFSKFGVRLSKEEKETRLGGFNIKATPSHWGVIPLKDQVEDYHASTVSMINRLEETCQWGV